MLDDMVDYLQGIRERPVWQPIPEETRRRFAAPMPTAPSELADAHDAFMRDILPFSSGNAHPGFMGWVQGGGNPVGMLAEMLAAGLNANCGGRDHMPIEVERQILRWVRTLFQFPESASGLFVTGTSMANFIGVVVARTAALGPDIRRSGLASDARRPIAYTSRAAHGCVAQAMELSGLGSEALRQIPVNDAHQIDVAALREAILRDRAAGFCP
jgi:aromatic-L-amino-acid decarboxylase